MHNHDMKGENGDCPMCEKGAMCGGMCRQHHWMHIIIKILVALFIFWCGVQFGELKSVIHNAYYGSGYGYGMMSSFGGERNQVYITPGMMSGWAYSATSGATTTKR
jgi:hypothetical protein